MEVTFLPVGFQNIIQDDSLRKRSVLNATTAGNTDFQVKELNEITLAGQAFYTLSFIPGSHYNIIPLIGALNIVGEKTNTILEPGLVLTIPGQSGNSYKINNEMISELSLFLEIKVERLGQDRFDSIHNIPVADQGQQLHELSINENISLAIGKFLGRHDCTFNLCKSDKIIFYIISGVFEVGHRLMEQGDAMILSDLDKTSLEFESLAVESIIMILRMRETIL